MKNLKPLIFPILISFLSYLYFFYPLLSNENTIYSGKDSVRLHYASRLYLYDSLVNQKSYPFWTDRMFYGYPIYQDLERGYQNIINLVLVYFLGPINSYKLLHFICYVAGSLSLYFILKRHSVNILSFIPCNLLYFFSFFSIIHQQHFNLVLTMYLLPLLILISVKYIETTRPIFILINSFLVYFLVTFGAVQVIFISFLSIIAYLISFTDNKKLIFKYLLLLGIGSILLTLPSLYYFYNLYSLSLRPQNMLGQGNLDFLNFINLFYPFAFGVNNYQGELLNINYVKNENSLYLGISVIILSIAGFITSKDRKLKKFLFTSVLIFLFANMSFLPVFNIFRYWLRAEILVLLSLTVLISDYFGRFEVLNKSKFYNFIFLSALFAPILANKNLYYVFKLSLQENYLIPFVWLLMVVISLYVIFYKYKYRYYAGIIVLCFDLLFFNFFLDSNLFMRSSNLVYENINTSTVSYPSSSDELSLMKNVISSSGYGGLAPKSLMNKDIESHNFNNFKYLIFISIISFVMFIYFLSRYNKKNEADF